MFKRFESIFAGTIGAAVMALLLSPLIRSVDASYTPVPPGTTAYFNSSTCPAGWAEFTTARGAYIVGRPAAGTLATLVGTALSDLENRATGIHAHTASSSTPTGSSTAPTINDPGHHHTIYADASGLTGGTSWLVSNGPNINNTNGEANATTGITVNAPTITVGTPTITVNNSAGVAGTNAPYVQLLVCSKS